MLPRLRLSTVVASALLVPSASAGDSKILIVGDSMGEFSCGTGDMPGTNFVSSVCAGSTVVNKAVSGSTAWQWRQDGPLSAASAVEEAGDISHVWLSVGGNDYMTPSEGSEGGAG